MTTKNTQKLKYAYEKEFGVRAEDIAKELKRPCPQPCNVLLVDGERASVVYLR